jgi:hypothetical protein
MQSLGREPDGAATPHSTRVIEAPWLVNGGHGASLRNHKVTSSGRSPRFGPHGGGPNNRSSTKEEKQGCWDPYCGHKWARTTAPSEACRWACLQTRC